MEKQNVGVGIISNKLCYYNGFNDVYATSGDNGWNTCNYCFNFNLDTIFWKQKNNRIVREITINR